MRYLPPELGALASILLFSPLASVLATPVRSRSIATVITDGQIADAYDFVIVGAGVGGLVLASRLSEDTNTTVLVLEAGDTGDNVRSSIDIPGNAYYSSLLGTSYDYGYTTAPQPNAGGRSLYWPRGKVIGGSSAVNGLYMVRPSAIEVDAWADLIAVQDGAQDASAWNWNSMFAAMKKSETFTPPSEKVQQEGRIMYDNASHGTTGPLHYSYPGFTLPVVGNWTTTLDGIGIPPSPDANAGDGWGAFIATSCINPSNWTRSYARSAYIDPLPPRRNLDILPNATVTRILFASQNTTSGMNATGVEFAATRDGERRTVTVRKEVLLAGGAIGSPQVLMLSGVGPADVLKTAGVEVKVELPGVGQHLQDHISTQVVWKTSVDTAASMRQTASDNTGSPAFLSFINSAIAYANITDLLGDYAHTYQATIAAALDPSVSSIVPSQDPTVIEGYKAIYNAGIEKIYASPVGQVEILLGLTGTSVGGAQSIAIQAALQHPFSQGRLYINSPDPFNYPIIDPQYLTHTADTVLLREGLKLARKLGQTAPLSTAMGEELQPGPSVSSDEDWDRWLAGEIGTEFHPSCTCAMLPRSQGGVVDSKLKVYGTANVRVVDSSIFPIQFAAHLQALVYGVGEQASSIIRAQYNGLPPITANATQSASGSGSSAKPTSTGTPKKNAALSSRVGGHASFILAFATLSGLLFL